MTTPARGIYAAYTHTDGFFSPPTEDVQGGLSEEVPTRPAADVEALLGKVKARLDPTLQRLMDQKRPLTQMEMQLLARAYHMKWTGAYRKPRVVTQLRDGIDNVFRAYRSNPRLAEAEPSTWNPEWFGLGPSGEVIALLREPFAATLDDAIEDGEGAKLMRRAAWSEMLVASRDWHRKHRRLYTNQSMINDLYGIYLSNKGVAAIDPASALSEEKARSYLYESIGLEPWRDSDPGGNAAPETSGAGWKAGSNYMQLTAKGLTKELGYVGYYGEVLDWVTQIYDATRPTPGQPGDEKIRKQLEKVTHARAAFRYPDVDSDGFRAMRIEAIIGWRDAHFPGNVAYAQRPSWDGSPLMAPAASLDERSIGYVQQMMEDNQFGPTLEGQFTSGGNGLRQAGGLLGVPDQYEAIAARKPTEHRLPMTPGQPDFVFSDEEDGVVALKHDDEILYVSLYWRARYAINFLARVHHITPSYHRIAVVPEEIEFTPSGEFYTRPNHINFGFGNGGPRYPDTMPKSAHAGEKLPIAMRPAGVSFRAGAESIHAGKGDFYRLPYGPYLIGMNMTSDRSYKLMVPADWSAATDLVSGKPVAAGAALDVPARTTVVLRRK
jgi:hypothetical protein